MKTKDGIKKVSFVKVKSPRDLISEGLDEYYGEEDYDEEDYEDEEEDF